MSRLAVVTTWLRPRLGPLRGWCRVHGFPGLVDDALAAAAEACVGQRASLPAVVHASHRLTVANQVLADGGAEVCHEAALGLALLRLLRASSHVGLGAPELDAPAAEVLESVVRLGVLAGVAGVDHAALQRVVAGELSELEAAMVERDRP